MNDIAVQITGIGKCYRRGRADRQSYNPTLVSVMKRIFRSGKYEAIDGNTFWALKEINLEICRGEVFGIIGHNGAGKSTLLKIIAGIIKPTTGCVQVAGRIAALLEVGTGFHQELTGRENIYMSAVLMGMKHRDVDDKFDEIVDFAGVRDFIDTPTKRYSSGMQLRLAFSVAAHLKADVLFVDEVLAVGDAAFQEKCLGVIEDRVRDGRTIVLVSHNMSTISRMCDRVALLDVGKIVSVGKPQEVIQRYLRGVQKEGEPTVSFEKEMDRPFQIAFLKILNDSNEPETVHDFNAPMTLEIGLDSRMHQKIIVSVHLLTVNGIDMCQSRFTEGKSGFLDAGTRIEVLHVTFPGGVLNTGKFLFQVTAKSKTVDYSERRHSPVFSIHLFNGLESNPFFERQNSGLLRLPMKWQKGQFN